MWIVRAYDNTTDELRLEVHLQGADDLALREAGVPTASPYVSTPLGPQDAEDLIQRFGPPLAGAPVGRPADGWEFFLEYEVPLETESGRAR